MRFRPSKICMRAINLRLFYLLGTIIFLNNCASQRISGALQCYGLDEKRSACVGDRLAETLSNQQLQSLSRAAKSYKLASNTLKISDSMQVGRELKDSQIPLKISQSALQCGLVSADVLLIPFIR